MIVPTTRSLYDTGDSLTGSWYDNPEFLDMRAILGNRRVRWGPREQSSLANQSRVVDCSGRRGGFARDQAVPAIMPATHTRPGDRIVHTQHGDAARDGVHDRAAIAMTRNIRPFTRVRLRYGHAWRIRVRGGRL